MKIKTKQKIQILERAYDKAAKFVPGAANKLAEMETLVLDEVSRYSSKIAKIQRKAHRDNIWEHFGWNDSETDKQYRQMLEEIHYGKRIQ